MKNRTLKLLVAALFAVACVIPFKGHAQKLAHVNSQSLLDLMPEVKDANKKLDTLSQQYQGQLKELMDEYQKKAQDFQNKKYTSETLKNLDQKEIAQLEERITAFQDEARNDLQKKQEDLLLPINNKIKDAIKAVAKENNYSYVFDSSLGFLLYANDSDDITALVKKKLGLK